MNKFELAFELPDKNSHLVAELLPKTEPELEWEETNNLRFYYRYDFLPAGVITRFIVLMHKDLEDRPDGTHLCWREGAVLHRDSTRALVRVKPLEKLIEIKINGSKKRELLAIIRNQFDHINSAIKKVNITEEIPCNCSKGCAHRFDYEQLLLAENKGKVTVDCPKSWEDVPLSALLDGFVKKEERMKEITTRDIYIIGQGGAIGPGAHAHDMAFNNLWNEIKDEIDLSELTKELAELRSTLKKEVTEPEHEMSIGAIAAAESSAKEGNGPKVLGYLKKAGKWSLDKAGKISVPVATAALKAALGL